jgi:cytochrome c oxidase subunit 2
MAKPIRNPIEWGWDQFERLAASVTSARRSVNYNSRHLLSPPMVIHRISVADLRSALSHGFADFGAYRTDIIFMFIIYPLVALVLARAVVDAEMIPLLFPIASGAVLVGPFAAIVLYEMSRRRELNLERHHEVEAKWSYALGVIRHRNFGAIMLLGACLVVLFLLWLAFAWTLYDAALLPQRPQTIGRFLRDVLLTEAGWWLIVIGCGVGFLFALVSMAVSVVAFPLLLDHEVGLVTAVTTSIRAALANPVPMAAWGLIVTGGMVLGALPLLVGLIIVLPVLGHATWHLYRRLIGRRAVAGQVPKAPAMHRRAATPSRAEREVLLQQAAIAADDERGTNIALILVLVAVGSVVFHVFSPWWWTPIASNWAYIDHTLVVTFWITGAVFTAIVLFVAYCVYRFHHRPGNKAHYEPENKKLEWWLTGGTSLGVAAMLAPGLVVWNQFVSVPPGASEIEVVGQQWFWSYRFPGPDNKLGAYDTRQISADNPLGLDRNDPRGADDIVVEGTELHLPTGKPIKVLLRSIDVLHDFYVPEFRAKMDMIPGMVTYFWLTPTREGTFDVLCAELCGSGHSYMRAKVVVESETAFSSWMAALPGSQQAAAD